MNFHRRKNLFLEKNNISCFLFLKFIKQTFISVVMDKSTVGDRVLQQIADRIADLDYQCEVQDQSHDGVAVPIAGVQSGNSSTSKEQNNRFVLHSENMVKDFIEEKKNINTSVKTKSDTRLFRKFLQANSEKRPVKDIPYPELDKLLARFFLSVRKTDGNEYEPTSLVSFQSSIMRHMREEGIAVNLRTDSEFSLSREALASKQKDLKSQGKGNKPHKSEPFSSEEIDFLWEKNLLGNRKFSAKQNYIYVYLFIA